jgi:hypothetical protein
VHAVLNGLHGFLNRDGKVLIPFEYEDAIQFSEGLVGLKEKGAWHYRDKANLVVISGPFDTVRKFKGGKAEVLSNNDWFFIDKRGVCVEHCPASLTSRLSSPHILAVQCRKADWNKLDVYLINLDKHAIVIDKIAIKVLKQAETFVSPGLDPSAEYFLPVDPIGEGNTAYRDISHYLDAGKADRFQINTNTTGVGYVFELTLFFNWDKYVQIKFDY